MCLIKFSLFAAIFCSFAFAQGTPLQRESSPLLDALRSKRSPVPDPHHHHHHHHHGKIHAHIHYGYGVPYVKPIVVPVVKPVVVAKPVYHSVGIYKPYASGYGGYGGYGGSHASSQASSHSFSAGLHSPFGGLGFSSSSAQSSAHSGAGWGK